MDVDHRYFIPSEIDHSVFLPKVLEKLFTDATIREEVVAILGAYGREDYHGEATRVHLGILRLSGSDLESIKRWTSLACSDYRDLLIEAEYRRSFGKDKLKERDPEKYAQLEQKERDEYRQWLVKVLAA
jgi:hypothetical protein